MTYQSPDDLDGLDGYPREREYGPEPEPFNPAVTRGIVAFLGVLAGTCAWFTGDWIRLAGIAFAVLFLCLAIMPARKRRR